MKPIEPFYVVVGRRIQKIRDEQKMSQAALGKKLIPPVTRASIANIEPGKQRILAHNLVQIAAALQTNLMDLIPAYGHAMPISTDKIEAELAEKLTLSRTGIKKITAELVRSSKRKSA